MSGIVAGPYTQEDYKALARHVIPNTDSALLDHDCMIPSRKSYFYQFFCLRLFFNLTYDSNRITPEVAFTIQTRTSKAVSMFIRLPLLLIEGPLL